jgi:drug/metabolite transporter (DMT)-like permease
MTTAEREAAAGRRLGWARSALPYLLLVLANLFWAGNWVTGRAVRDLMPPIALNFWRWVPALLLMAPFALPGLVGKGHVIRRELRLILLLGFLGVAVYTTLVYFGLRGTTAVNAALLNSSIPVFMLLASWVMERERASARQIVGVLVSFAGILIIMKRGEVGALLSFELHLGDGFILAAVPAWAVYSVLLKRGPPELGAIPLLFLIGAAGTAMLLPLTVLEALAWRAPEVTPGSVAAIAYLAVFASFGAYACWNRAVAELGANLASFSMHLLPAFGTVLAIVFLGESIHPFHIAGLATILCGVWLATAVRRR